MAAAPGEDSVSRHLNHCHANLVGAALECLEAGFGADGRHALLSEQDEQGRPVAYNKVTGMVVTGNEDGAHHVINEISGALLDIGFTVPGQAWTYWNKGPGPGETYLETDYKHDWSKSTGELMAANLVAVARALAVTPIPPQS